MEYKDKSREQLIGELEALKRRIAELERKSPADGETGPQARVEAPRKELDEEKGLLEAVFAAVADGITVQDRDFHILYQNQSHKNINGSHIGEHCYRAYQQRENVCEGCLLPLVFADGATHRRETMVNKDGSTVYIEVIASPIRDAAGGIIAAIEMVRDITRYKEIEEALRAAISRVEQERSRSDSILAALGDGLSIQDTEFKILFQNQIHKSRIGDHAGEYCYRAYQHRNSVCPGCPVEMSLKDGGIHQAERVAVTSRGVRKFETTASPLKDRSGRIMAGIEIVRDITDRKNTEEALRQSEKKYRDLVDNSLVGVYRTTVEGDFLYANRAMAGMLEHSVEEVLARSVQSFYKDPVKRSEMIKGLLRDGKIENLEIELVSKSGKTVYALLYAALDGEILNGMVMNITGMRKMQDLLVQAKQEWEDSFNSINEAITINDLNFRVVRANRAAGELLGKSLEEITKYKCHELFHGTNAPISECPNHKAIMSGGPETVEIYEPSLGKHLEIKALPRFDRNNNLLGIVHVVRDLTARKKFEQEQQNLQNQLIQSQKMESVGRLVGGIAHDFNNILCAILGYSELVMMNLPQGHPMLEKVTIIKEAGERAALLTKQLLAFSRKQVLEMKTINLNTVIENMGKMLTRIIGEDIKLELNTGSPVENVTADPVQVEQILMNIAVNARDAMPSGGKLVIETADVEMDVHYAQRHNGIPKPGKYVMLSITDTGEGMSPEVRGRIFEPFFTTKELGKGTGLGLATVYGIVKQHNGYIYVYSEPGKGTTFKIYLPVSHLNIENAPQKPQLALPGGTETILVAEDEPSIRELMGELLRPLGYNVLEAAGSEEALNISGSHKGCIDLLLTDIVMPGMNGRQLAKSIKEKRPGMKVIFMSGYADGAILLEGAIEPGTAFLNKPIMPAALAGKIRELLD
ncbi:MAG: PAS domain S-box protein [Nitrospiraceae bacterium]|nr:PAS domain S-box protein [Nitrospiraceae bacterium]